MIDNKIEALKGKLIVSCQALPDEPLHSSFIMGRMAKAAKQGGASGIRANTAADIKEIQKEVDLPIIGIVKKDYDDSKVYITPTMDEIDELAATGVEIIALDATSDLRPNGKSIDDFYNEIKEKYPNQLLMADCSTVEEALHADELGFDFIGTTLVGYTDQSKGDKIEANDFEILRKIIEKANGKVIAEGNINTPEKAKRVIELGAHSVVVGSIITRPQVITKNFVEKLSEN
ncbi:N-acetylmannosamine-6-phosphate 2-epimerase [Anaerococcus sp. DFU013_CI05]|uniref:N-acetylmannosamine-6-phosphate 2-epimerase n=1 Tax=Anaerococcus sp. AH8042_DFU013_CI05 TaxID=3385202 RepID=UPI003A5217E9